MPSPAGFADAQCKSQVLAHDVRETSDLLPTGASHHSSVTEEHDKPVSIAEWLVPPPVDVDADAHVSPQRARLPGIALVVGLNKTSAIVGQEPGYEPGEEIPREDLVSI